MNACVPSATRTGLRTSVLACSKHWVSGPWGVMMLWRLPPPGRKPSSFASYFPRIRPMNSDMVLRWKYGGRKVCSYYIDRGKLDQMNQIGLTCTPQRGGKMAKSIKAVPGSVVGAVMTVKMDGSYRVSEPEISARSLSNIHNDQMTWS